MSGESWLAIKDSSTHQSWISRPGIQFFSLIYVLYLFLPFIFYFLSGWRRLGPGGGGGGGAARFGPHYLPFYFLEASVYKCLLVGRPLWSPLFLKLCAVTGWVASGSFRVLVLLAVLVFKLSSLLYLYSTFICYSLCPIRRMNRLWM